MSTGDARRPSFKGHKSALFGRRTPSIAVPLPGRALCRHWRARASPRGPQGAAEVRVPAPGSRTASGVSLGPRPLRARPRGPARSRPARHLGHSGSVERGLSTAVRAKSRGLGTQAWGKRVSAAGDSGPRPGSPPGRPRLVRAVLCASPHSSSGMAWLKPAYPGNLGLRSARSGPEPGGVFSFWRAL